MKLYKNRMELTALPMILVTMWAFFWWGYTTYSKSPPSRDSNQKILSPFMSYESAWRILYPELFEKTPDDHEAKPAKPNYEMDIV